MTKKYSYLRKVLKKHPPESNMIQNFVKTTSGYLITPRATVFCNRFLKLPTQISDNIKVTKEEIRLIIMLLNYDN